jgi:hypothetical protein
MADANDTPAEKRCSKCGTTHSRERFTNSKSTKDGKCAWCKPCQYAASAAALAKRRDEINERRRRLYALNPQPAKDRTAAFVRANRAAVRAAERSRRAALTSEAALQRREYATAYYRANAEAIRPRHAAAASRRIAQRLRATPAWADEAAMQHFYDEAAQATRASGAAHEVDHIVPLQSKKVCGLHCEANLRVLGRLENIRKGNRFWPDMW